MEEAKICFICQDFEKNVGHAAKWCPKNICQKCGQNGHVKTGCMFGLENFPLPNEIFLQILGYLDGKDLEQCVKVSKRFKDICKIRQLDVRKRTRVRAHVRFIKKPHICPLCDIGFIERYNMKAHITTHLWNFSDADKIQILADF